MADPGEQWSDNVGGNVTIDGRSVSFYVDRQCILCSVCSDTAPQNFKQSDAGDHDVCFRQPADADELLQCYTALENCPVEAIGDNGVVPSEARNPLGVNIDRPIAGDSSLRSE